MDDDQQTRRPLSDIASPPPAEDEGIQAYHGSPHEFEQFDISKIGTGEGAQSYGYGLYFAGHEPVASQYRINLAGMPEIKSLKIGNRIANQRNGFDYSPKGNSIYENIQSQLFEDMLINHAELTADPSKVQNLAISKLKEKIKDYESEWQEAVPHAQKLLSDLNRPGSVKLQMGETPGHMYEVRINAHPDHFLDWDKPLSKQSDYVRKALEGFGIKISDEDWRKYDDELLDALHNGLRPDFHLKEPHDPSGENIYNSKKIVGGTYRDHSLVSKALLDAGIKGIKYLDAGSRREGEGTRNYVVFDDKLIKVKRRYEQGGAVHMASGGEAGDTQAMPQEITPEQQGLLDQLSRAIDESLARYGQTGGSTAPIPSSRPTYNEPTMPGEPPLTREQEQDYHINRLEDALRTIPAAARGGAMGYAEGGDVENNPAVQKALALTSGNAPAKGAESQIKDTENPKRILVPATGPGKIKGIVIPRHMWEGGNGKHGLIPGMRDINQARASVYGSENRDPLTIGKVADIHKDALDEHFKLPIDEQISRENAALQKLRAAMHIGKSADTLDESEKLDTVRHEYDEKGRPHVAYGSKGIAGHALYTSGTGENQRFHVLNVCPGQTTGCGGGVDENGIVDTKRGTCFAPNAEAQYPGAAIRRACHTQAKFDPAMTRDWIIAHAGSLRRAAERADANGERVLFRPNVVDESDRSTRYAIKHLNDQREEYSKKNKLNLPLPDIIANSYGKTTEMHDPENGIFVTYSNTGPKTKLGQSISENASRDNSRIRQTILAQDAAGRDLVNDDGEETPPKGSYMVTDVHRGSELDKRMQKAFKYAKYWSAGKPVSRLSKEEIAEGEEGHFGKDGKPTTPEKAHYGHVTLNGIRYDYQKQHILHPRLVQVGKNKDGTPHMIPTDSRFMDEKFLPKSRFVGKSGKKVGAILLTTPTTSTSSAGHQTSFTHHVGEEHIKHALANNGEYEIDPPAAQQAAAGKEYVAPKEKAYFAHGGAVGSVDDLASGEEEMCFPERSNYAQVNNVHRSKHEDEKELGSNRSHSVKSIDRALRLTSQYNQPTRGRP